MRAIGGNPPIEANSARSTNIPWSPVAMPVRRERAFIIAAIAGSQRERPVDRDVEAAPAPP
jgi:hypothetical protein